MLLPQQTLFHTKKSRDDKKESVFQEIENIYEDPVVLVDRFPKRKFTHASLVSPEIFRVKSVWPFELLPDELIIEEKRIIIKQRVFPFFEVTNTVQVDRITLLQVSSSIFFSSIFIKGITSEYTISWLKHDDARTVKEIVDGLRIKQNESLKISENSYEGKIQTLQILGSIY